jgi:hypothetical protein
MERIRRNNRGTAGHGVFNFFNFFPLCFFLSLQSTLSQFQICSHNFLLLGVNSERGAKLSSFSRECLALGLEEELWKLICQSFPSEAFIFTELRGKEVSFTAKVGCSWWWLDYRHLKGSGRTVCMDRNRCYSRGHQCFTVSSGER